MYQLGFERKFKNILFEIIQKLCDLYWFHIQHFSDMFHLGALTRTSVVSMKVCKKIQEFFFVSFCVFHSLCFNSVYDFHLHLKLFELREATVFDAFKPGCLQTSSSWGELNNLINIIKTVAITIDMTIKATDHIKIDKYSSRNHNTAVFCSS